MSAIAENFTHSTPILERVCRCWRYMVLSYRTAVLPLLPSLAQQLANGFQNTRQGCFLWATDSVLREFAAGAEYVDDSTSQAIYQFFEQQAVAFLRIMNDLPPFELPDGMFTSSTIYLDDCSQCKCIVIEDFFRLLIDALIYYHQQLLPAPVCEPIIQASISALNLEQDAPLIATLHFLRDFLSYGTDHPNSSTLGERSRESASDNYPQMQQTVKRLIESQGEALVQRILTGMMFHFPKDCLPDASGVLHALFEIMPHEVALWIKGTLAILPPGTVRAAEGDRLMSSIGQNIQSRDTRKIRALVHGMFCTFHFLQPGSGFASVNLSAIDFTNSYRRRNVAPRDGLGRLEATRFRFSG